MSLAGAADSIIGMLKRRFDALPDAENPAEGWNFRVVSAAQLSENLLNEVSLFVYRVELDANRRHAPVAPAAPGDPPRQALAVELKLLLIVWGNDARRELQVLGRCMEFLDQSPLFTEGDLDSAYAWPPGAALQVTPDAITTDNLLQLWDALTPSFRLSMPYVARTIRLTPYTTDPANPPVDSAQRIAVPRGRRP